MKKIIRNIGPPIAVFFILSIMLWVFTGFKVSLSGCAACVAAFFAAMAFMFFVEIIIKHLK